MKIISKIKDLFFCFLCYCLWQKNFEFFFCWFFQDFFVYSIYREYKLNFIIIIFCSIQECDVYIFGSL